MNRSVYYIGRNMPVPLLMEVYEIILQTNVELSGRKSIHKHVKVVDITYFNGSINYDGAIIFENRRAELEFHEVARNRGFNINEHLLFARMPYIDYCDRVMLEYTGDGRMSVWVHHQDTVVHLTGDQVAAPHWEIPEADGEIIITDLIIAGCHNYARTVRRRFEHTMREFHKTRLKVGGGKGLKAHDWEWIVGDLRGSEAKVWVVTNQGLVIQIGRDRMQWVRPSGELPLNKYPQLLESGYSRFDLEAVVRPRSKSTFRVPSKFAESVSYIAKSVKDELNRY